MSNTNIGIWLACGLICVYPIIGYLVITYGLKFFTSHDWTNIQWSEIRFPWSKHD